ncbi:MAG: sigma-70 family RNA polymerase sigma factor, partial [Bacteroidales bacterium]|nr:sigma-70 family RNA polymerase sigma factor [Bacteroidales bacterium]
IHITHPIFPYLISLTRNRALNYVQHKKIQNNHVRQHLADDPTYTLSDDSAREELLERILARIELLPERCSQVMKLSFIECKKYKEIAEELNISVNTVKTHITMGLKTLRDEFPASLLLLLFSHPHRHFD